LRPRSPPMRRANGSLIIGSHEGING
jgi:hypothetical protein